MDFSNLKSLLFLSLFSICLLSCNDNGKQGPEFVSSGHPGIDKLSKDLESDPNNAKIWAARGELLYQNEAYDDAIADLQKAIKLDSLQPDYYHLLADAQLDYFKSKDAIRTMEKAANSFQGRIPTLLKLSEFYHIVKKYPESMLSAQQVLKKSPLHPEGHYMIGRNFKEMGNDNSAILNFQKTVQENPEHIDAYIEIGQLYTKKKEPIALRYFDNALAVDSTRIDAWYGKALYHQSVYQDEEALKIYRKIMLLDTQYEDAYYNSAVLYFDAIKYDDALKMINIALEVEPTFGRGYYFRGIVYAAKGEKEKAILDLKQSLVFDPEWEKAYSALEELGVKNYSPE